MSYIAKALTQMQEARSRRLLVTNLEGIISATDIANTKSDLQHGSGICFLTKSISSRQNLLLKYKFRTGLKPSAFCPHTTFK